MFTNLENIRSRPHPFGYYTAPELWNDEYVSKQMLNFHLNENVDLASRNKKFIEKSADWIIKKFNLTQGTSVCDFGCGPGLYTSRFANAGAEVTGIDISENSIRYAKEQAEKSRQQIEYVQTNYLEFNTDKKFDLITMIFCDICVLSPEQRTILLGKFKRFLKPGGKIFLDVFSPKFFSSMEEKFEIEHCSGNGFWSEEPYFGFMSTFKYDSENLILNKHTIIEEKRERTIYNWLQSYDFESIEKIMIKAGFNIINKYSNVAGDDFNDSSTEIALELNLL